MSARIIGIVPKITLVVPQDLFRKMKAHPEVGWSEVVRRVIDRRIRDLDRMDALTRRSTLTVEDVHELDHLMKERHRL